MMLINLTACVSVGTKFVSQLDRIHHNLLTIYQCCSKLVQQLIWEAQREKIPVEHVIRWSSIRLMCAVRKTALEIFMAFSEKCATNNGYALRIFDSFTMPVLEEYRVATWDETREPCVLACLESLIEKMGDELQSNVGTVLQCTFEVTLRMITRDMAEYPEHRLNFFGMLRAITSRCPQIIEGMSEEQVRLLINSIVWAFRHTERNIAEIGLRILHEVLQLVSNIIDLCIKFHRKYYQMLVHEIFAVLTDTFHKPGFKIHVKILHHLLELLRDTRGLKIPIWRLKFVF